MNVISSLAFETWTTFLIELKQFYDVTYVDQSYKVVGGIFCQVNIEMNSGV